VKLSPALVRFGIKKEANDLRYSDPEKTILDFIYLARQKGTSADKIVIDISSWTRDLSKNNLKRYAPKYPKSVSRIIEMVMR
jgi:hypothetical protein